VERVEPSDGSVTVACAVVAAGKAKWKSDGRKD
jgi:hypothetical protein